MREGASQLVRSAGASPAQARPSKPPGSECCVRRQRCRTRSVHSRCMGCGSEPRNDLLAGAETVFIVERNRSDAVMRGIVSSRRGRGPHHVHKDRIGNWEVSRLAADVEWVSSTAVRIGKARAGRRAVAAGLAAGGDPRAGRARAQEIEARVFVPPACPRLNTARKLEEVSQKSGVNTSI